MKQPVTDETLDRIGNMLELVRNMLASLQCGETAETEQDGQAAIDEVLDLISDLRHAAKD